ncbi:MAG: hypothetical protein GY909_06845 [Oligoflexia bacterium]|nr:hypothetical protein [Oligoflexia bacterium]
MISTNSIQEETLSLSKEMGERLISEIFIPLTLASQKVKKVTENKSSSVTEWMDIKKCFEKVRDSVRGLKGCSDEEMNKEIISDFAHSVNNSLVVCFVSIERICREGDSSSKNYAKAQGKIEKKILEIEIKLKGLFPSTGKRY